MRRASRFTTTLAAAPSRVLLSSRHSSCLEASVRHRGGVDSRCSSNSEFSTTATACIGASSNCSNGNVPLHRHGSLLLKSRDTLGIVSAVSDVVLKHGCNMTGADLHVEKGRKPRKHAGSKPSATNHNEQIKDDTFVCRFSFETDGSAAAHHQHSGASHNSFAFSDADSFEESFNLQSFEEHVVQVVTSFHAEATLLHQSGRLVYFDGASNTTQHKTVLRSSGPARMAVFASSRDHCLNDLIDKCRGGDLPVQISYVVSNYLRTEEDSHVHRALSRLNVPYHYISCGKDREREEWEADIQSIITNEDDKGNNQTDFIVLARFMQILSPEFLLWYAPRPIINIHHGLLPSFKGSNPYRQAFDAGVKLIGATAHFVTDELDEGPIIEQRATGVTHRDSVRDVRIKSETLEANALHDAVRYVAENRVARVGGRTIAFT